MTRIRTTLALAVALAALISVDAQAQDVPEAVATLQQLVGSWTGSGTFTGGESPAEIAIALECETVSGNLGVLCQTEISGLPGMGTVSETDLFGYDPAGGLVHWFSVTSAGETHDHAGGFMGNALVVEYISGMDGQLFSERVEMTFVDANTVDMAGTIKVGTQTVGQMSLRMTR